jgi:hypothetical protein
MSNLQTRLARLENGPSVHQWSVGYNGGWAALSRCGLAVDSARLRDDSAVRVVTCGECIIKGEVSR